MVISPNDAARRLRERGFSYTANTLRSLARAERLPAAGTKTRIMFEEEIVDTITRGALPLPASEDRIITSATEMPGGHRSATNLFRKNMHATEATEYVNAAGVSAHIQELLSACYAEDDGPFPGARFTRRHGWYIPQAELDAYIADRTRPAEGYGSEPLSMNDLASALYRRGLPISPVTLRYAARNGTLPAHKDGNQWVASPDVIERILSDDIPISSKKKAARNRPEQKPVYTSRDAIPEGYMDPHAAREHIGVSRQRFADLVHIGRIERIEVPGFQRRYAYKASDVEREAQAIANRAARRRTSRALAEQAAQRDEEAELLPG